MEKGFYTPQELAKLLGLTPESIRRAIKAGEIPALKLGGRYYIPTAVVQQLVEEQTARRRRSGKTT